MGKIKKKNCFFDDIHVQVHVGIQQWCQVNVYACLYLDIHVPVPVQVLLMNLSNCINDANMELLHVPWLNFMHVSVAYNDTLCANENVHSVTSSNMKGYGKSRNTMNTDVLKTVYLAKNKKLYRHNPDKT